jgi:hypothetical protein
MEPEKEKKEKRKATKRRSETAPEVISEASVSYGELREIFKRSRTSGRIHPPTNSVDTVESTFKTPDLESGDEVTKVTEANVKEVDDSDK